MTVDEAVVARVAYELFPGDGDLCSDTSSGLTAGGEKAGKVELADDARMALESAQKLEEMMSQPSSFSFDEYMRNPSRMLAGRGRLRVSS